MTLSGALVLVLLSPAASWPQAMAASAAAKRKELNEVERQLEQKKQEIERYRRRSELLQRDLSILAGERSVWRGKLRALERRILDAERKKAQLKAKLGALELAQDRWREVLARETNGYLRQSLLEFDFYGGMDVWERPLRRAAIMEKAHYVRDLSGYKLTAQKAAARANEQEARLETETAEAAAERRRRESLYRLKQDAWRAARQKFAETAKDAQELQDSAAALTQLVRALERKPRRWRGFEASPSGPAQAPHSLPWPAHGRVVASFGKQYLPELRTWVVHHGIRLATGPRAPVHPVREGKVIFAGPFRSYGSVIIVDHGRKFYTIYGRLGQMFKKPGDRVGSSDVLGTAETSGPGGVFYFEIRQSVDALDPIVWLRRR